MATTKTGDKIVGKYNHAGSLLRDGAFIGSKDEVDKLRQMYSDHANREGTPIEIGRAAPEAEVVVPEPKKRRGPRKKEAEVVLAPQAARRVVPALPPAHYTTDVPTVEVGDLAPLRQPYTEPPQGIASGIPNNLPGLESIQPFIAPIPLRPLKNVFFNNSFGSIKVKVLEIIDNHQGGLMLVFPNEDALTFYPKVNEFLELVLPDHETVHVLYSGLTFPWTDGVQQVMILMKADDYEPTPDRVQSPESDEPTSSTED